MDVLTWIQDSTDIIHAIIKWDVLPSIKKPESLIAKYPRSQTEIRGVFRQFELLRKNVHDSWKCRPKTPPHGESNIQPQRLDAQDELKQVSRWLECVIKVSKGETDIEWMERNVSVNARQDVVDKTDEVHEKLNSIFTKCMSLNKSDEQPRTNKDSTDKSMQNQKDSDKKVQKEKGMENNEEMAPNKSSTNDENPQKGSEEKDQNAAPEKITNVLKIETGTQTDIQLERGEELVSKEKDQNEATEKNTNVLKIETGTQTDIQLERGEELGVDGSKRNVVNLQKDIQILNRKLEKVTAERDNIESRLSKMMSVQLKNNNPGIADLSDTIRPTKIAEKYGQLYDDEWTDGFQHINHAGSSEKESIEVLLQILKECFAFCEEQEKAQGAKVVKALVSFESKQPSNNAAQVPKSPDDLNSTAKITLNELRRQTGVMSKETVINEYFNDKQRKRDTELTPYIEKCLELCWYMVLQSPPVYMELEQSDSNKKGSPFNKDLFRHYSRTGKTLGFIVWPALYLHKGGPLLAKGVAQPEG